MAMTWQQKYDNARPAKVRTQEKPFADLEPGEVVVIPSPQDAERALWEVPHGQTRSQRDLRNAIAQMYNADNACPAVTGIQLRVMSALGVAALDNGDDPELVVPFWRVVEPGSTIATKLAIGTAGIVELRSREGITRPE